METQQQYFPLRRKHLCITQTTHTDGQSLFEVQPLLLILISLVAQMI